MAKRVTQEDIIRFNELYHTKYHTYAAVARETGFSAGTVSRYIKKDYTPMAELQVKKVTLDIVPAADKSILTNISELSILSEEEKTEMEELWKELSI